MTASASELEEEIAHVRDLDLSGLRARWRCGLRRRDGDSTSERFGLAGLVDIALAMKIGAASTYTPPFCESPRSGLDKLVPRLDEANANQSQPTCERVSVRGDKIRRETVCASQRPGGIFAPAICHHRLRRPGMTLRPARMSRKSGGFSRDLRKPDLRRTAWWRTHSTATSLQTQIP
jgi:hypothetical protein